MTVTLIVINTVIILTITSIGSISSTLLVILMLLSRILILIYRCFEYSSQFRAQPRNRQTPPALQTSSSKLLSTVLGSKLNLAPNRTCGVLNITFRLPALPKPFTAQAARLVASRKSLNKKYSQKTV